jgi:peptide/nickel transport system permease protein
MNLLKETFILSQLWRGKEEAYALLPVTDYKRVNDSIVVQKFIDEGITERQSFHLSQLMPDYITTKTFFLGSDKFGRDILSRLIVGTRVSLSVGFDCCIYICDPGNSAWFFSRIFQRMDR